MLYKNYDINYKKNKKLINQIQLKMSFNIVKIKKKQKCIL